MAAKGDPSQLEVGRSYQRRRLHEQLGLGGNWQKGISYPAEGDYTLIFSDPEGPYGHLDGWASPTSSDIYHYSGEWSGKGDMKLGGGNLRVVERTPNIYLFLADKERMRFEGRFELEGYSRQVVDHEGSKDRALIFQLKRATGRHVARIEAPAEADEGRGRVETQIRLRRVIGGVPPSLRPDAYAKPADAERLRALQEKARQGHRDLLVLLAAAFSRPGATCREDPFSVDLLVHGPKGADLLVEVKTLGRHETARIRSAVGQLYEYEYRLRKTVKAPLLAIAVDRPLRTSWLRAGT